MRFVDKWLSKNARTMLFSDSDGVGRSFRSDPENVDFFLGGYPCPYLPSPEKSSYVEV
jgi:hypothetical protein